MTEIKLEKRYPQSRVEDITDAFMRGYEQGRTDGLKVGGQIILAVVDSYLTELEQTETTSRQNNRKTENCSEKPNNCEPQTCENRKCKNYDTINDHCMFIEQCHYEPKDEPQTERRE